MTKQEAKTLIKEIAKKESLRKEEDNKLDAFLELRISHLSRSQYKTLLKACFNLIEDPLIIKKIKNHAKNLLIEIIESESKKSQPPSSWIS